ncbi:EAL domain-containing protein [Pelagibius litoralis]|uniref:EAL domain-containing protein n=1 Tax=Pelagibius litoralis TaxID=374515 RepID=A0A967C3Z0_9PROT|nr:EAL domain-containing protein [Pelagibius litoralis]NIA68094.1 EAL domain-containing protein [Pelagibius litoralis]
MSRPAEQSKMQEQALLNHIKRLERSGGDYFAVQAHLSRLIDFERLPECLDIARTMMARVAKTHDASLFDLFNKDLFLVYNRASVTQIDEALSRLCRVLREDPFFASEPAAEQAFCSYFDLEDGYQELLSRAESLVTERAERDATRTAGTKKSKQAPISLTDLAAVEKAIAQADLSAMTSRQAVCELDDSGQPQPLFHELFTSMSSLRDTLLPGQDIFSDRWLFQYLTTKLDQRMLAWLGKNDDATLKHSFSLNINIASLLSPRFLELDEQLDQPRRNSIIIELQMQDIYVDVARYLFAREFLLDRGYRICLDGITELSLPYVNRADLGAELVKLQWSSSLRSQVEGKNRDRLREALERIDPKRVVLTRCESDDALELGSELGIKLFQGYFLDHLLSEKITREEAGERLAAAMTRHRRSATPATAAVSS